MMICLLALIVILAINSLTLDGAMEGVKFYLVPDFERAAEVGIGNVIVAAMNQSFFTLSLASPPWKSSAAICPTPTACPARPCGSAAWTPSWPSCPADHLPGLLLLRRQR